MHDPIDETVYYASEILQILMALDNVYYAKPWYTRWIFKPWHDALQTAAMVFAGKQMVDGYANKLLSDAVEDYLDE